MAMHKKLGRFDIQLFGDVFADFDQVFAAAIASAGFRFMAMFDARNGYYQTKRQRAKPGDRIGTQITCRGPNKVRETVGGGGRSVTLDTPRESEQPHAAQPPLPAPLPSTGPR